MVLCACGCGNEIPYSIWQKYYIVKYIQGHNKNKKGMVGRHHSEKTKEKMSESHKGKHRSPSTEFKKGENMGENHPRYVGGRKITAAKAHAKRDRELGFIPLNKCKIDGWEGHHIDKEYVIYVPRELHHSIYHNVFTGKNMDEINFIVLQWYVLYYWMA